MNSSIDIEIGSSNSVEYEIGKNKYTSSYNPLTDKPQINGVELVGNKTTEDLGIKVGSDIELITEIKPESIEEDLEENQIYNGNAIHDLARLFGMTIEELTKSIPSVLTEFDIEKTYEDKEVYNANAIHQLLELFIWEITQIQEDFNELYDATAELYAKRPYEVEATFTLSTQKLTGITKYYDDIKDAYLDGRSIKLTVTIAENGNKAMANMSVFDTIQQKAFFYPIMRTNIGSGNEIYFFDVQIGKTSSSLTPYVLSAAGLE